MTHLRRAISIIKWISLTFIGIFLLFAFIIPLCLGILGYKVDASGSILGKEAATKGKVDLCSRIIVYHSIFGPPTGERRAECIRTYAEIKKDPTACELLMPSDYGWYCFGDVESQINQDFGCGSTKQNINCGVYDIYSVNLGIDNCNIYKEQVLKNWCYQERSAILDNVYECEKIVDINPGWKEECQSRYAFKIKDTKLCDPISNQTRKELCILEIDSWLNYSDQWSFADE